MPHTPLGPGGAPFARWRPIPFLVGAVVALPTALLMLSDRAPGWLARFTQMMASTTPRTAQAVRDSPVPDAPFLVHVLVWAVAAALVFLVAWSWLSVVGGTVLVVAAGVAIEVAQELLSDSRTAQARDVVANLVGIGLGIGVGLAIWAIARAVDARSLARAHSRPDQPG